MRYKDSKDDEELIKRLAEKLVDDPIEYPASLSEQEIVKKLTCKKPSGRKSAVKLRRLTAVACMAAACIAILLTAYWNRPQSGGYDRVIGAFGDILRQKGATGESRNSIAPAANPGTATLSTVGEPNAAFGNTSTGNVGTMAETGSYLYTASGGALTVADISDPAHLKSAATVTYDAGQIMGLCISGNTLAVIVQNGSLQSPTVVTDDESQAPAKSGVTVHLYDVTNPASPHQTQTFTQDGTYSAAELTGGSLYIVTNDAVSLGSGDKLTVQNVVPYAGYQGKSAPVPPSKITIPSYAKQPAYTVISGIALEAGDDTAKVRAILGGGSVYLTSDSLYIFTTHSSGSGQMKTVTDTQRLSLRDGALTPSGSAQISGSPIGAGFDEQDGYLRIVTSQYAVRTLVSTQITSGAMQSSTASSSGGKTGSNTASGSSGSPSVSPAAPPSTASSAVSGNSGSVSAGSTQNSLYILDSDMHITGKLENFEAGQPLRSACFTAESAYLTTYGDPVAVVDLSDPQDPKLLGVTTLGGSPDLLLPYSDHDLIEIGSEKTAENSAFDQTASSVLHFIDAADPMHPKVLSTCSLGVGTSLALSTSGAVLTSSENGLIGLPVATYVTSGTNGTAVQEFTESYSVFGIDPSQGLILKGSVTQSDAGTSQNLMYSLKVAQAFIAGDTVYGLAGQDPVERSGQSLKTRRAGPAAKQDRRLRQLFKGSHSARTCKVELLFTVKYPVHSPAACGGVLFCVGAEIFFFFAKKPLTVYP